MTLKQQELIEAIERVDWTECDWLHDRKNEDGKLVYATDDEDRESPIQCEGMADSDDEEFYGTCLVCQEVRESARRAERYGKNAIELIKAGDTDEALKQLELAESEESEWGDSPEWGPVCRMADALFERETLFVGNDQQNEVRLSYTAEMEDLVNAIWDAADDEGTIQAGQMVDLFPGQPILHTTTSTYRALLAAGCMELAKRRAEA